MSTVLLIMLAAGCNTLALTMLKIAGDQLRLSGEILTSLERVWVLVIPGVLLYFCSFILTISIFSGSLFSRTLPIFVGINVLSSFVLAFLYFKETISPDIEFGSVLIVSGICLIQANAL